MIDFTGVTALRIPEGDVTKVVRKSDGVVLWEKVTSRLPREYQEVEYIKIPRDAYIDSGFTPADDTTFYIRLKSYDGYLFGTGNYPRLAAVHATAGSIQSYNASNGTNGIFNYTAPSGALADIIVEIETYSSEDYCQTWINGTTNGEMGPDGGRYWSMSFDHSMYIGAWWYSASSLRTGITDIYAVRAQIGSTQYLDLVPAYRKADNVAGLYNLINGEFLTNAGSGTITIGPIFGAVLVWKPGYGCEYAVGKSFTPFVSASYTVSEAIAVEPGTTYKLTINATASGSGFRFVGANGNGVITEATSHNIYAGDNTFTFTPSRGTTQMRIRTYAGNENWTWKLSKG